MSKYNNVNPDHYKRAGRERPGKAAAVRNKARSTEPEERERWVLRGKPEARNKKVETSESSEVESQKPEARSRK